MTTNEGTEPRLTLDWERVRELRERFWQVEREKETLRRKLEAIRRERARLVADLTGDRGSF